MLPYEEKVLKNYSRRLDFLRTLVQKMYLIKSKVLSGSVLLQEIYEIHFIIVSQMNCSCQESGLENEIHKILKEQLDLYGSNTLVIIGRLSE